MTIRKKKTSRGRRRQQTRNPDCLAEFLRHVPDRLTENQKVFLAKEFIEPYCPDDMYANLEFVSNELFFSLSDAELGALLRAKVPDWNPFILIENLVGCYRAKGLGA